MQARLIITAFFVTISFFATAQFQKGMIMAGSSVTSAVFTGGATDYSGNNQTGSKLSNSQINLQITPSIGWFVNSHTVVGGLLIINYSNTKLRRSVNGVTDKKDNTSYKDFGVGAFGRYYFTNTGSVKPFLHAYLNGGTGSFKTDGLYYVNAGGDRSSYDGESSGRKFLNAGINLGITKMFTTSVGLDIYAGYGYSSTNSTMKNTVIFNYGDPSIPDTQHLTEYDQKYSGHTLNIGIGFQVFLSRK